MPTLDQQSKERVESLVYGPEAQDRFWSKSREDQIGILKTTAPSVFGGLSPHDYGVFLDSAQKEFAGMKTGAATTADPKPAVAQPESHWYNPATWNGGSHPAAPPQPGKPAAAPPAPPQPTPAPGPVPTGVLGDKSAREPKPPVAAGHTQPAPEADSPFVRMLKGYAAADVGITKWAWGTLASPETWPGRVEAAITGKPQQPAPAAPTHTAPRPAQRLELKPGVPEPLDFRSRDAQPVPATRQTAAPKPPQATLGDYMQSAARGVERKVGDVTRSGIKAAGHARTRFTGNTLPNALDFVRSPEGQDYMGRAFTAAADRVGQMTEHPLQLGATVAGLAIATELGPVAITAAWLAGTAISLSMVTDAVKSIAVAVDKPTPENTGKAAADVAATLPVLKGVRSLVPGKGGVLDWARGKLSGKTGPEVEKLKTALDSAETAGSGSGPVPPPAADPRPPAAPASAAPAAASDRAATQPLFPDKLSPSQAPPGGMPEWYKVGGSLARWDAATGGYRFVDPTFGGRASEGQRLDTRPFSPHEVRASASLLPHQRWVPVTAAEAAAPPPPTPPGWREHTDKPTIPPDPVAAPRAALKDKNGRVYVWMDRAGKAGEPGYGDPGGKVFTEQEAQAGMASGELTQTAPAPVPAGMAEVYQARERNGMPGPVYRWDQHANSYMGTWPDGRTLPSSEHTVRREARSGVLTPVPPVTTAGQTVQRPPAKVYRASQPATPGSTGFASPGTEEWLTMEQAQANLNSEGQRGMFATLTGLVKRIGGGGSVHNTIGSWRTGVENSLMFRLSGGGLEDGRYVASRAGLQGGQKQVIAFAAQEGGNDGLWTFDIGPEETPRDLRDNLLRLGLEHHTLEPYEGGTRVHVFDPGSELEDIIEKAEGHYGTEASYIRGTGEFIGGETAAEGRTEFERIIGEYEASHPAPGPDEGVPGAGIHGDRDSGRSAPGSEEVAPPAAPGAQAAPAPPEPAPPADAGPVHAPTLATIREIIGTGRTREGDVRGDRGSLYESVGITNDAGKSTTISLTDVSPEALDRAARELGESKGMLDYTWHTEDGPVPGRKSKAVVSPRQSAGAVEKPGANDQRTAAIVENAETLGTAKAMRSMGEGAYPPGTVFEFMGESSRTPGKYVLLPKKGGPTVTASLEDVAEMFGEPVADVAASRRRLKKLTEDLVHGESGEEEADPRLWDAASLQRFGQDVVTVARGLMQDFEQSNQGFRGQNFHAWAKSLQDELGARIRQAELPGLWNALHPESGNFYSRLERAIEQKMQDKARLTPDQIRQLAKSGAVKDEEIRYVLDAALKNLPPDKITKQALLQEVRSHQITLVSVNPKPKWEHPQLVTPGPYRNYTEHLLQFPHNKPFEGTFESQVHWPGYPDVVVHARTTDRVSIDGKKMLHGEEFQADPHQQARKEVPKSPDSRRVAPHEGEPYGYRTPEMENELRSTEGRFADVTRRMSERGIDPAEKAELFKERDQLADKLSYLKATVPDMPWKKTSEWSGLIMQKMLAAAAHGNYERLSWTTGEQQNVRNEKSGVDFTSYYDRQLVGFMKSYVKKWGAEVKRTSIQTGQEWNEAAKDYVPAYEEVWYVDITPQMRADLLAKGQSLLSLALLLGGGAAAGAAGAMKKKKKDREAALATQ